MAIDKAVDSGQLSTDLTSVANAIRTKSGGSSQLAFPSGFVSEIGSIPTATFSLIGTKVFSNVAEFTNTTDAQELDTEINITNTDYAMGYAVITCDSAITTSTEWGMSVLFWGRYSANGKVNAHFGMWQKGSSTFSKSALAGNTNSVASGYGLRLSGSKETIVLWRKCDASGCPKFRAGNYTVKVYGMRAI